MVSRPARLNPPMQSVRLLDPASGLDGVIAIHSTAIGPGAGGCRFWHYADIGAALDDACRLAEGMSYKNAMAGLPFGGAKAVLRSLDYVAMENEDESGAFAPDPMGDHPGAVAMGEALDLMELRVIECATERPPAQLPPLDAMAKLAPPPDTADWPVRALRLRMDEQGRWFINDWNFHLGGHDPAFTVKRGAREVWEIRNSMTSMPHPMHLHGFQFRVVSRAISPPDVRGRQVAPNGLTAQDLGWNDTVVVWPGEIVRLAIDFSQPFAGVQRYMLHCHNLEHEDMGMMLTFAVAD